MLLIRSLDVTNDLKKFMTERPKIFACIRKVINVVVKKFMMNIFVIIVTDFSAWVVNRWKSAREYTTFLVTSQNIIRMMEIQMLMIEAIVYNFQGLWHN